MSDMWQCNIFLLPSTTATSFRVAGSCRYATYLYSQWFIWRRFPTRGLSIHPCQSRPPDMPNIARQASLCSIEDSATLVPRAADGGFGSFSAVIYQRIPQGSPSDTTTDVRPTDGSQTTPTVPTTTVLEPTTTSSLGLTTTLLGPTSTISEPVTTDFLTTSTTLLPTSETTPSSSFTTSADIVPSSSSSSSPIRTSSTALVTASLAATHVTGVTDNGRMTTTTSSLSTSLSTSVPSGAIRNRTAIIAGSTCAAVVLIFIIFAGMFLRRRHKMRRLEALTSTRDLDREGPREGRGLLAGEGLDDYNSHSLPTHSYRDSMVTTVTTERNARSSSSSSPQSPSSLSFHRARSSEVGSIFREEVWPPPADFVDPFARSVRQHGVQLGNIVDDVMGSQETEHKYRRMHSPSPSSSSGDHAEGYTNSLDGYFEQRENQGSSSSMHSRDSSGSSDTVRISVDDQTVTGHEISTPRLPARTLQNPNMRGVGTSRPKNPSPLAKTLPTASGKAEDESRMWLDNEGTVGSRSGRAVDGITTRFAR